MKKIKGEVTSGNRHFKNLPPEWVDFYKKKTKMELVEGSLNIGLGKGISFNDEPPFNRYKHQDTPDGRYAYLIPCEISKNNFKRKAFIVRIQNVEEGDVDYHPKNIIELLSDINFHNSWNLKDGDEITIDIKNGKSFLRVGKEIKNRKD